MKSFIRFTTTVMLSFAIGYFAPHSNVAVPQLTKVQASYFTTAFLECDNLDELEAIFRKFNPDFHECLAGMLTLIVEAKSDSIMVKSQIYRCLEHIHQLPDEQIQKAELIEPLIVAVRRADTKEMHQLACDVINRVCGTSVHLDSPKERTDIFPFDPIPLGYPVTGENIWRMKFTEALAKRQNMKGL